MLSDFIYFWSFGRLASRHRAGWKKGSLGYYIAEHDAYVFLVTFWGIISKDLWNFYQLQLRYCISVVPIPDSKVHGANMGPTWVLSAPDGPHADPMNLAIRDGKNDCLCWVSFAAAAFHSILVELSNDCCLFDHDYNQPKIFDPFNMKDEKEYIPYTDIDPDSCYYNELSFSIQMKSNYYHENSFNQSLQKVYNGNDLFSLMHLNIRSIPSNLSKLVQYLSNLNVCFDIIGLSETWLTETNKYIYHMDGYNHVPLVRPDRIHGGVSLFISAPISYRILNEISIVNKDIECLFVEIELNDNKMYVGVIYRTPDADVRNFCDILVNILDTLKPNKQTCYLMGDYNINLLKNASDNPTSEFLDLMFSSSFIPLINKPTRVTHNTATIIDNIFANKYENDNKFMTGILTTDISDHYPIFHITLCHNKPKEENYQMIRLISVSNLEKYKNGIQNHDGTQVNNYNSCPAAFTYFFRNHKNYLSRCLPSYKSSKTLQK